MQAHPHPQIPSVLIIDTDIYTDERGYFAETWQADKYKAAGIQETFLQDNLSFSRQGVVRGLHFQSRRPQGKLVYVLQGCVQDVAVDLRPDSATFGQHISIQLSAENAKQIYIPPGFAHGFCVLSSQAVLAYKCTALYDPGYEHTLLWNDAALQINWQLAEREPIVSAKDKEGKTLAELKELGWI